MPEILKYCKKTAYILAVIILIVFFCLASYEQLLGTQKTGLAFRLFTLLIVIAGILAIIAIVTNRHFSSGIIVRFLLLILTVSVLSNTLLFNKLRFQKLPSVKGIPDNSLISFNRNVIYSNHDYPVYFYCRENHPNSVLYANIGQLNNYGISAELLKAWGGVTEIIDARNITKIPEELKTIDMDTLSIKQDTIFLAGKYSRSSANDTLCFIAFENRCYIIKKKEID